jgi:hypothetical protein
MGIPACLWRRTGEIFKGNAEFAKLIGVDPSDLLDVCPPSCSVCNWFTMTLAGAIDNIRNDVRGFCCQLFRSTSQRVDPLCLMLVLVVSRNTDKSPLIQAKRPYSHLACLDTNLPKKWVKIRSISTAAFRSPFVGMPGAFQLPLLATSSLSDTPYE